MIDNNDTDKINSVLAIKVLISFYKYCKPDLQFKFMVNLLTLIKGFSTNKESLVNTNGFFDWLSEVILDQ